LVVRTIALDDLLTVKLHINRPKDQESIAQLKAIKRIRQERGSPGGPKMVVVPVLLPTRHITDWATFHETCRKVLGFPEFYGANMNAWIDCMADLRDDTKMSSFFLKPNEMLVIGLQDSDDFRRRLPEIAKALEECVAFVNQRCVAKGQQPVLTIVSV
jgi:RNAse (barnase) inhibitor barstar